MKYYQENIIFHTLIELRQKVVCVVWLLVWSELHLLCSQKITLKKTFFVLQSKTSEQFMWGGGGELKKKDHKLLVLFTVEILCGKQR